MVRTMLDSDKIHLNRLRRVAARQGLRLERSRRRDPRAVDFATYRLLDARTRDLVAYGSGPSGFGLSLPEVEAALGEPTRTDEAGA